MTKQLPPVNVGIDVGKARLDVYLLERDRLLSVPNDEHGVAALVSRLSRYRLDRIVIEATGRLEQRFVRAALAKRLPVIIVSPMKVRRFAGAIGQLAKTDEIDARLIAQFAATIKPAARPMTDEKLRSSRTWWSAAGNSPACGPWRKTAARSCRPNFAPASIASSRR